jgi:osmotically inducible protein OsmC
MAVRNAGAIWEGNLKDGRGSMKLGSGAFEGAYSFASRFEEGRGTNPEELIGAAHSGCFSMALSASLEKAGYIATRIETSAKVHLGKIGDATRITHIDLDCEAIVEGIGEAEFQEIAEATKTGCPVSAALASTEINLAARLVR